MNISTMLDFLKCPCCGSAELSAEPKQLTCDACDRAYEIVEGIPILIDESNLDPHEIQQRRWFDDHYSRFPSSTYSLEKWRLSMLERIFGAAETSGARTYLDIGCGATGYTVIEAASRMGWLSLGADISLEAMVRARNLAKVNGVADLTGFVVCSAENLPFKNESIDYVSAISLLEHLVDDVSTIRAITRVVAPNGLIYICVPNSYANMWPLLWPAYLYVDRKIGHVRHYSIDTLDRKMQQGALLKKDRVFYNGHLIKLFQIALDKLGLLDDPRWWNMEKRDINQARTGVQLNAVYKKT